MNLSQSEVPDYGQVAQGSSASLWRSRVASPIGLLARRAPQVVAVVLSQGAQQSERHSNSLHEHGVADAGEIFLYYVDDSDGDTFFFNEKFGASEYTVMNRYSPKKGKGVLFDNSIVHASSPPRLHERRMTLNFVFKK